MVIPGCMAIISKLDIETYTRTKDMPGGPVCAFVEEEVADIEIATDGDGNPTRGGLIGYAVAYVLIAGTVLYLFFGI